MFDLSVSAFSVDADALVCMTEAASGVSKGFVNMTIDQTVITSDTVEYSYVPNPQVTDLIPKKSVQR